MNLYITVIVSVVLVYGEAFGHSICPPEFSMDWKSKSCWNITAMRLEIQECQTALPDLRESVHGLLESLLDMQLQIRQLKDERDARSYVSNNAIEDSHHIQNLVGNSTREVYLERVSNGTIQYGSDKQETTFQSHLSVASNQIEDEQTTQTFEFISPPDSDEPIMVERPLNPLFLRNQFGKEEPAFELSPLDGRNDGENTLKPSGEDNLNIEVINQSTPKDCSDPRESDEPTPGEDNLDIESVTQSTPKDSSAIQESDEAVTLIHESPEQKMRQLEHEVELQKKENDAFIVGILTLEHKVEECEERFENEKSHCVKNNENLEYCQSVVGDLNEALMEAKSNKDECEALQEESETRIKQMEEILDRLRFQQAEQEEMLSGILSANERNLEVLAAQKNIIKKLRAEIYILEYSYRRPPQRISHSDEIEEFSLY